jgi:hypothetical protein
VKRLGGAFLLIVAVLGISAAPATAQTTTTSPTVGSTIATKQLKVTLRAYRQPVTLTNPSPTTAAGTETAAIDVKACNRTGTTQTVAPYQFFLEAPVGKLVIAVKNATAPRPQLQATPVAGHRCTRGWLSFQVPAGGRAASVVFQSGGMFTNTLHKWTVPTT